MNELADTRPTQTDADAALTAIYAQTAARTRMFAEVRPANMTAVFDALAAAVITTVEVAFEGAGDSGQIERIDARVSETDTELPDVRVALLDPKHDGSGVEQCDLLLREAIEALVYDCLEETHDGLEIDEGAYGEFTFDVAARTISLEYNERYLETHFSQHQF